MTPTAQEVAEHLTTKIIQRYSAAFNSANRYAESGSIGVDISNLVVDALTTFASTQIEQVKEQAEQRCQLIHPNPRCLVCRQTLYPGEDGYRCFDCREWFCVEHARRHFKADVTDRAKQLLAEERRAVWEEAAQVVEHWVMGRWPLRQQLAEEFHHRATISEKKV